MKNKDKYLMTATITFVMVIVGIFTSVLWNAIAKDKDILDAQRKTRDDLQNQLIREMSLNSQMEKEIDSLKNKIQILENESLSQSVELLKEEYDKAKKLAGLSDVVGSGIVITIDSVINVDDFLKLINDLKMADAQAISVNDERIVAMTDISFASGFIYINGIRLMENSYEIRAIGEPQRLETMVNVPGGVLRSLNELLAVTVTVKQENNILIPKIKEQSKSIKTDLISNKADQ